MAITNEQEGSQTATISTEHQLGTEIATDKVFVLAVDMGALANGDVVEVYAKTKLRSTGALQLAFPGTWSHAQVCPNKYSSPIPSDIAIDFYLKQTAGTGRAFPWKILSLNALTASQENTKTATAGGTEDQLGTEITASGVYLIGVDLVNLAANDELELRAKTKVRSGGTLRVAFKSPTYRHVQSKLNVYSPPILCDGVALDFYLTQTAGSARDFPWKIYKLA